MTDKIREFLKQIQNTSLVPYLKATLINHDLICSILETDGYCEYYTSKNDSNKDYLRYVDFSKIEKYIRLTETIWEDTPEYKHIKDIINSHENANGKIIKIIIDGKNLPNLPRTEKKLLVLEPEYNYAPIEQIIGKGIRYNSHSDLIHKP